MNAGDQLIRWSTTLAVIGVAGLFDEFDVSGKVLHAATADLRPAR